MVITYNDEHIQEVEPDEWDLEMVAEARRDNTGEYISFDDVLESLGLTLADLETDNDSKELPDEEN